MRVRYDNKWNSWEFCPGEGVLDITHEESDYPQFEGESRKKAWEELFPKYKKTNEKSPSPILSKNSFHKADIKDRVFNSPCSSDERQCDGEKISNDDKKEWHQKHVQMGQKILQFLVEDENQKLALPAKKILLTSQKKGRPPKENEEKIQSVSMKLPPLYVQFFKETKLNDKKAKGVGGKVRFLVDYYLKYQKREKEQLIIFCQALSNVRQHSEKYLKIFERPQYKEESEKVIVQMEKSMEQVKLLLNILKFEVADLKKLLSDNEMKTLELSLSWVKHKSIL